MLSAATELRHRTLSEWRVRSPLRRRGGARGADPLKAHGLEDVRHGVPFGWGGGEGEIEDTKLHRCPQASSHHASNQLTGSGDLKGHALDNVGDVAEGDSRGRWGGQ